VGLFLLVDASSGSGQQYLYTPTAVENAVNTSGKDGVLVQDVSVQKGDTLYGISRKFSGHGSYYPQILLFNDIKDPNLIYPGNVFKIPVSHATGAGAAEKGAERGGQKMVPRNQDASSAHKQVPTAQISSVTDISIHDLKKVDAGREKKREKSAGSAKKQASVEKQHAAAVSDSASGQKLFERAVKAYRQDDYRTALELFDKYLAENQASPLAADASLYKAECYLQMSAQK
jgi:nucleoid-associated protein YgaU